MNFECHITIMAEYIEQVRPIAEKLGFHMSNITDDIVMGPGPKGYCTKNSDDLQRLMDEMDSLAFRIEDQVACVVLRKKIEAILMDVRIGS